MERDSLALKFFDMLQDLKDDFIEFIPNILFSIIVLIVGYLLARLCKFIVIRLIRSLHRVLRERVSVYSQYVNLEQSASFIGATFFWLLFVSTFVLISDILGLEIITVWMEGILKYSPNLLVAILIIILAVIGGRIAADVISSLGVKIGLANSSALGRIVQYLILVASVIIAFDQIGVEVAILVNMINIGLAALLFGAALAFGLGARTAMSNILATFYIRKRFKAGDQVKIEDIQGRVTSIDGTYVVIDTQEGQVVVPAKNFSESKSILINKEL
ncbi:MAG: mechanosensitive ion channel [Saprospiraceae bacterium]|nr:mechanosensitive ion channel [Saprospiraceae bacterium]